MKEVKITYLNALTESKRGRAVEELPTVEKNLAKLLSDGWQIAGTGGEWLDNAFVILVRERQE